MQASDIGVQWPGWRRSGGDGQDMAPIGQRRIGADEGGRRFSKGLLGFVAAWSLTCTGTVGRRYLA